MLDEGVVGRIAQRLQQGIAEPSLLSSLFLGGVALNSQPSHPPIMPWISSNPYPNDLGTVHPPLLAAA